MIPDAAAAAPPVVIGIPTAPQWATGDLVAWRRAAAGSRREDRPWRVVVARSTADPSSAAVTREGDAAIEVPFAPHPAASLQVPFHGMPGRTPAIRSIFREALRMGAAACLVLDPRTGDPGSWVEPFVQSLLDGEAHFVSPEYGRHPFAAGLTEGVLGPVYSALFGVRVGYPLAPHFGCSSRLIETTVEDPFWETAHAHIAIEPWLLAQSVEQGLGIARAAVPAPPRGERVELDLSTTITQVVGVMFDEMERSARVWQRIRGIRMPPVFGAPLPPAEPPRIDGAALAETFRQAQPDLEAVWAEVLPPLAILQWRRLASAPTHAFRVADPLWARTLYDFAMGYRLRLIGREHLLEVLTPLYLAWLASLVLELDNAPPSAAEERLERLCRVFVAEKPYLVAQWRWPERFRPMKLRG